MLIKKYFQIGWLIIVIVVAASFATASADDLGMIDKNDSYDIYYAGNTDGGSFIVKRVRIVRIEQINGVDFLVFINDSGFNAKAKEGFVLFSTVKAIVPSSTFTVSGIEKLKN